MRILGADSLTGKDTSMNAIPVTVLQPFDMCVVKTTDPDVPAAVMFYEYVPDQGGEENLPYIVTPLDNLDENVNIADPTVHGSSRWVLKNIYTLNLTARSVTTNTITPEISGSPITVGDDLTIGDHGIIVDGQVNINSEWYEPPMIVNSSVMVENLNAEYLNGQGYDNLLINQDNHVTLPDGVNEIDVYLTDEMLAPPHYSVMIDICNIVDDDPSIYGYIITNKEPEYFTIKFSGHIDSPNYTLHYFLIGETDQSHVPPPSGGPPPSGSPSGSPPSGSPSGSPPPSGSPSGSPPPSGS